MTTLNTVNAKRLTAISKSPYTFSIIISNSLPLQNNNTKNNVNEWQNVAYTKYN